jgi:large subunit ribosomal protein L29
MAGRKQKKEELRGLDPKTLSERIVKAQKDLVMLRISQQTGDVKNPLQKRNVRKEIARMKTIQKEREIQHAAQA